MQGYGIDAFREDEKKFLISAGAGAAKVRSVVLMHRLGRKRFTGEIEIAAFDFFFKYVVCEGLTLVMVTRCADERVFIVHSSIEYDDYAV